MGFGGIYGGAPRGEPVFESLSLYEAVVVSSTILRAFGVSSWTGATANGAQDREQYFWQNGSQDAYIGLVQVGDSLVGSVSSTEARAKVPSNGVPVKVFVPAGYDTCIVKAAASTEVVYGEEWVR